MFYVSNDDLQGSDLVQDLVIYRAVNSNADIHWTFLKEIQTDKLRRRSLVKT